MLTIFAMLFHVYVSPPLWTFFHAEGCRRHPPSSGCRRCLCCRLLWARPAAGQSVAALKETQLNILSMRAFNCCSGMEEPLPF